MAGATGKIVGACLFALGAIIVIAAAAMLAFIVNDQADNEQSGPLGVGEDQQRSDDNLEDASLATLGMAVGALLAIGGIIGIAVGIGQRTGELKREWHDVRDRVQGIAPTAEVLQDDSMEEPQDRPWMRPAMIAGGVVAGVVLIAVIAVAAGIGPGEGILGGGDGPSASSLGNETIDHRLPAGASLGGVSQNQPGGTTAKAFDAPAGTVTLRATVDWTPTDTGVDRMRFTIEYEADGAWTEIDRVLGGPGMSLAISSEGLPASLGDLSLRFRAFPGDDGVTQGQDYSVEFAYFNK